MISWYSHYGDQYQDSLKKKNRNKAIIWPCNLTPWHNYPDKTVIKKDSCTPVFFAALCTIPRICNHLWSPLKNEWVKKLWSVGSVIQSCPTLCDPWTEASQASLSNINSRSLLKLMSIELVMPANHLILSCPLLLPSVFPRIRVFSNESVLHIRWPKYWSFSFSISPSNEYSGLYSYRIDWLDLLEVQGTVKSLLQHTVQNHQFFDAQLSLYSNSHIHTWLLEKP